MEKLYKLILFLVFTNLNAQTNKVIYVEYKTVKATSETSKESTPEIKKLLETHIKAIEAIEFGLVANDSIGIFKKTEKMTIEEPHPLSKITANGVYYTNLKSKQKMKQIVLGEKFNVLYPFDDYEWQITTETKIINGFTCYKATTSKEVFSNVRNKIIITNPEVWFAPEIPYRYGPFGLIGLPGFVLEATLNGKIYYYATKVNLDYKQISQPKLEWPKSGKFVTEKEMEQIQTNASVYHD